MTKTKNKQENKVAAGHALSRAHVVAGRRSKMEKEKFLAPNTFWKCYDYAQKLIFDPNYVATACYLILLAEVVLNYIIVENVAYTEIDWKAYMQEVEGFLNGTLDYAQIKGDTGPCVYPAGFLYVYTAFYYLTSAGANIRLAQYIFIGIYVTQSYLTYTITIKTCKLPGYALILSFLTSYRIHSIYVLRLFNDPIAVLFFWAALNAFISDRWKTGSLLFSLAVSIKMNILLYSPCLLLAYMANLNWKQTISNLFICGIVQLFLGLPFLLTHPWSYLKASFDLGRVFQHQWTVNYRFLDEEIFTDMRFHIGLLVLHITLLGIFTPLIWKYFKAYNTLKKTLSDMKQQVPERNNEKKRVKHTKTPQKPIEEDAPLTQEQQDFLNSFEKQIKVEKPNKPPGNTKKTNKSLQHKQSKVKNANAKLHVEKVNQDPPEPKYEINFSKVTQLFVLPFFVTNLIGIACARSLHYQFYSWYFHSLLYLAFSTPFSKPMALLLLGLLESSWNIYPSTEWSSATLHVVHAGLLYGLYKTMRG
ncbi:LOW QUALITY PROTEIN: lethal(2)neighbour of tid protein 2 [Atheta coriaria]|uniref:LOW QUALITY PROTEIN: lethal(2)neighbour of tid protein 2 n=1 Tax=Dalotia coriaria TaxID=877792 RepID=UPI0031F39703